MYCIASIEGCLLYCLGLLYPKTLLAVRMPAASRPCKTVAGRPAGLLLVVYNAARPTPRPSSQRRSCMSDVLHGRRVVLPCILVLIQQSGACLYGVCLKILARDIIRPLCCGAMPAAHALPRMHCHGTMRSRTLLLRAD